MSAAAPHRRALLVALACLALGGLLLHLRVHPIFGPDKAQPAVTVLRADFVAATLLPLLDLFVVTALFASRRTAPLGYLINGMLVIYGTVLMGAYSVAQLAGRTASPMDWVLKSTLADMLLAWGDFAVGKVLYDSWMREA